jgi:alpha-glucosidase
MPWLADAGDAGFGSFDPWLPVGAENAARAVDRQEADPASLLHHTRAMLALRKAHPALHHGAVTGCEAAGDLLRLTREADGERVCLVANFGEGELMLGTTEGEVIAAINRASAERLPAFAALVVKL